MTLHLIKLAVGAETTDDLRVFQQARMAGRGLVDRVPVFTRRAPRRAAEVIDGGSLYWVVRGVISVRQRVLDICEGPDEEGRLQCEIWVHPQAQLTEKVRWRPFQGWRYLSSNDTPPDLPGSSTSGQQLIVPGRIMPEGLAEALDGLGVRETDLP